MNDASDMRDVNAGGGAAAGAGAGAADDAVKNAVELALLTAGQPLDMPTLMRVVDDDADDGAVRAAIERLRGEWAPRALRLIESASGWQFVSKQEYVHHIRRLNPERPPRLSRSLLEVLAVIAYRQPVTRGDIEQIRGIAVSSSQIAFLEEASWIEEVGRRDSPGRPVLYATTNVFLDDLGLASLNELPPLPEPEEDAMADAMGNGNGDAPKQADLV